MTSYQISDTCTVTLYKQSIMTSYHISDTCTVTPSLLQRHRQAADWQHNVAADFA